MKCKCRHLWTSELHGLTVVIWARSFPEQVAYASLILACLALSAWWTVLTLNEYLGRQTTTLISVKQEPRMRLPSVVICPKNPDSLNYPVIIREIRKRIPSIDRITLGRLMVYAIAGAGFYNMEEQIRAMSSMEVSRLDALLRRWKGRRRYGHFYRDLFEKNGYTCEQFFRQCYYGHEVIPCCDIFRSHYVMLRGRCFRMAKFYQEDPDSLGRLTFFLNNLSSPLAEPTGVQQQIIAYFVGKNVDIPTFPRLYISQGDYFRVKLLARRTVLLPWNPHCFTYPEDQGRSSCYVRKWLDRRVIGPLNCTVFYLRYKNPEVRVCSPKEIVTNYENVTDTSLMSTGKRCKPACDRFDHIAEIMRSERQNILLTPNQSAPFVFGAAYPWLEYEKYEEVVTTTLPGFISQLGGQSGLFIGFSLMSIVQFSVLVYSVVQKRLVVCKCCCSIRDFVEELKV